MPTPNIEVALSATISVTDNLIPNDPQVILINFNNPTLGATTSSYDPYFQAFVTPTTVQFPGGFSTVFVAYVRNQDPTNSIQVSTTTPATATPSVLVLAPGGVYLYFNPVESSGGINSLILTGLGGTASCEVLVAV